MTADSDIECCQIAYCQVKVSPKSMSWSPNSVSYYVFTGRSRGGQILTDEECRKLMALPVIAFTTGGDVRGARDISTLPKPHELDSQLDIPAIIRRVAADTDEVRKEEIAAVTERARLAKSRLNREVESLKNELRQIDNALSRTGSVTEKIDAEKRKATASRALKSHEQSLFMDGMKIDVEAEAAVRALADDAKLEAVITRLFVIDITGGSGNG